MYEMRVRMRSVQERPVWCTEGVFEGPVSTLGGFRHRRLANSELGGYSSGAAGDKSERPPRARLLPVRDWTVEGSSKRERTRVSPNGS